MRVAKSGLMDLRSKTLYSTNLLYSTLQVLPDAGVNPTTGTRAGSTAFYSLDEGKTRFYDLMQVVEFYTLNQGSLNTRLSQVF